MNDSPLLQSHSASFAQGLAQGVLRFLYCTACETPQTLTRYICTRCRSPQLIWRDACGVGTVYATSVVNRAPSDEFRALAPYLLVLVDLEEGGRVMGQGALGLSIGDRVRAGFRQHADRQLMVFQPCGDGKPMIDGTGETR